MRRSEILRRLAEAGEAGLSGERLAQSMGVTRAAVCKHVAVLRAAGYDIRSMHGSGYRLVSRPDLPLPYEVKAFLHSEMWRRLTGGGATMSTNDDAKELARDHAAEGTVVLATRQTHGRGRLGREWSSPEGGVYLSAILRPPLPSSSLPALALVVGLGVALGLEQLGARVGLKWPNDVLALGPGGEPSGKLCGVLVETSAEIDRVEWVVAGVGVNVRREPGEAASGESGPAFLDSLLPHPPALAEVAAAVLDGVEDAYVRFLDGSFAAVRGEYMSRLVLTGRVVTVSGPGHPGVVEGVAEGVDDEGRLLVRTTGGVEAVAAGDVTLRRPEEAGPVAGTLKG